MGAVIGGRAELHNGRKDGSIRLSDAAVKRVDLCPISCDCDATLMEAYLAKLQLCFRVRLIGLAVPIGW